MDIKDYRITGFSKPVSALPDNPTREGYTAQELKEWFDSNSTKELKESVNGIIDHIERKDEDTEALILTKVNRENVIEKDSEQEYTPTKATHPANKGYVDDAIEAFADFEEQRVDLMVETKADKSNVIEKDSAQEFTPTADTHPANKGYVDRAINEKVSELGAGDMAKSVYDPQGINKDIFAEFANYFPLSGGTITDDLTVLKQTSPSVVLESDCGNTRIYKNADGTDNLGSVFADSDGTGKSLELNLDCTKAPANGICNIFRQNDGTVAEYQIFGQHNKPYGVYTGTGSAAAREIDIVDTTALGNRCAMLVNGGGATVLVTAGGAFGVTHEGTAAFIKYEECNFTNGKLVLKTANNYVNMAKMLYYRVL